MASVQKRTHRGKVQYRAMWREPGLNGKDRLKSKTFDRSADAKAYANKMELEVERRGVGDPENRTTAQYLKSWVDRLEARGEHSPTTIDAYIDHIKMVT